MMIRIWHLFAHPLFTRIAGLAVFLCGVYLAYHAPDLSFWVALMFFVVFFLHLLGRKLRHADSRFSGKTENAESEHLYLAARYFERILGPGPIDRADRLKRLGCAAAFYALVVTIISFGTAFFVSALFAPGGIVQVVKSWSAGFFYFIPAFWLIGALGFAVSEIGRRLRK